jgi:hypothetical protein
MIDVRAVFATRQVTTNDQASKLNLAAPQPSQNSDFVKRYACQVLSTDIRTRRADSHRSGMVNAPETSLTPSLAQTPLA